jgi:hypothetical protein
MSHDHGPERAYDEEAVLDIGGNVGALILTTGSEYRGQEVEVSPLDDPDARIHTAIHERRVGDRVVFAGIFPELRAGIYRIWTRQPGLVDRVRIVGGEVAAVDWTAGMEAPLHPE